MIDWRGYTGAWAAILVLVGTVSSPGQTGTTEGLVLRVYDVAEEMTRLCELAGQQTPNVHKIVPFVEFRDPPLVGQTRYQNELGDLELQDVKVSFDIDETFTAFLDAEIEVPVAGDYGFRLTSDDGSQLFIDGELAVDHDGLHALSSREATVSLTKGLHALHVVVFQNLNESGLILEWLPPSADDWEVLPQDAFLTENDFILATAPGTKSVDCSGITSGPGGPGDGKPLEGVHPSYDLIDISRTYTSPQIGGMDFLPDGRLLVTDWNDNDGNANLWVIEGAKTTRDGLDVTRRQFAGGFQTSLGLLVLDVDADGNLNEALDGVYVLENSGLYRLRDSSGDGDALDGGEKTQIAIDASGEDVSLVGNFSGHQFNFGLVWKESRIWATLSSPGGGKSSRGHLISIDPASGDLDVVASGLRTPNGIGLGPEGDLFGTDNQGDWVPANKFIYYDTSPGAGQEDWYGFRNDHSFQSHGETPPTLWLPHGEISMSPTQPLLFPQSSQFSGQVLMAELTHGGAKRIFLEKIAGEYQGAVFRFTQGLEVGIVRALWDEDDHLYLGGLGGAGHVWNWKGTRRGLQKLVPNGKVPFEILAIRSQSSGFEIEFTKPVDLGLAYDAANYLVKQWHYAPTSAYGGPKLSEESLTVESISVSLDRRKVFLELPGVETHALGRVVYFRLLNIYDETGEFPWSTEGWYTLHTKGTVSGPDFAVASAPGTDIKDGLLAWWDFDEGSGTDVADRSGRFDGTASGAGWTSGVSGSALEFDGDAQVSVPSAALNLGSEFTISAWIRSPLRCDGDKVVIAKGPAAEGGFEVLLDEHNELRFRAAEVGDIASGMVIPQNRWTHVAVSYNGALMRFFQGGTLFALKTVGGSLSDESEVIGIGANAAESARYFDGQLDEVVVHDRALSSGEVEELSAGSPVSLIPKDGLVAYWSFQEGCGTSVRDHSGNRHHGTLTGATWQPGILDRSLLFDGSADRIFLGASTINPAGTFTIACWVRSEDVAFFGEQVLLEKDAAESFADFKFYLENGVPRLSASGYDGNFAGDFVVPSDGNWHHVAVSYDGVDMEFYLDGVFRRVHTPVWGVLNGQAGPTAIGARPTSSAGWFRGIDRRDGGVQSSADGQRDDRAFRRSAELPRRRGDLGRHHPRLRRSGRQLRTLGSAQE